MEHSIDTEQLIVFGGAVKALGDGKVGGHVALFSTAADPDLADDYFDAETDFDLDEGKKSVRVLYDHGLDQHLKRRKLGRGTMAVDDLGVWIESQLEMRDDYERAVYKLAEMGKLGWSTGSAPHLVERVANGKSFHLKAWPIVECSLTPRPTEPRTNAIALKSLTHLNLQEFIEVPAPAATLELKGLPSLAAVLDPASYLKTLNDRAPAVEAAFEELRQHQQVIGTVIKSHLAALETTVQARVNRDGRLPSLPKRQHIETMQQALDDGIAELSEMKAMLTGIRSIFERSDVDQQAFDELARAGLLRAHRLTGLKL